MKNKIKIFLAACLSAVSSSPIFMVMPQESSAAQRLGGLNITQDVCRSQTFVLYVKPVVLNSRDAYSWRCRVYPLQQFQIQTVTYITNTRALLCSLESLHLSLVFLTLIDRI